MVSNIRRQGMVFAFDLNGNFDRTISLKFSQLALQEGLIIRPLGNVVYFMPPYIITNDEVDFVVDKFGEREYIQVADFLSSDEVIKREFGAFKYVADNFPKYVITMDKINYSQNGIIHLNLEDFLLGKIK